MNLRWLLLDHVPSGVTLTKEQRTELVRRSKVMRFERRSTRRENMQWTIVVCAAGIAAPACMFFIVRALLPTVGSTTLRVLMILAAPLVFGLIFWIALAGFYARTHAPYIRRTLNEMGIPVCEHCAYVLRDLPDDTTRCPECGAERAQPNEPEALP